MKKSFVLYVLLPFWAINITAQEVVASAGETQKDDNYEVSWTIGEPIIETVANGTVILTQGLLQTKLIATAVNKSQNRDIEIKVYPNPTQDFLNIHLNKITEKATYSLFDLNGKLIEQKSIITIDVKLDMTKFPKGTYLLKLSQKNRQPLQTYKVIKR